MRPTLYEFAGGADAFVALATAHHARCLADPELNVERLAAYWVEVLGGPPVFSQTCGSETSVLRMHAGNGHMDDLAARFVSCFVAAMDDVGLPADPEFRAAMRGYMEWAVGEMTAYPDSADDVPPGRPMPRWTWTGLQPQ